MNKIPTLFVRNPDDRRHVLRDVAPECEWVFDGFGVATRKYDGTCVMFDGTAWWARREVKPRKDIPAGYQIVQHDEVTGKLVGWEPIAQSAFAKYHAEAIEDAEDAEYPEGFHPGPWPVGTYELIGPKVNGNPERCESHELVAHERAEQVPYDLDCRSYDEIRAFLADRTWEGLVYHGPNGLMAKIKARDFAADGEQR